MTSKKTDKKLTLSVAKNKRGDIKAEKIADAALTPNVNQVFDQAKQDLASRLGSLIKRTITTFEQVYYPEWIQAYKDNQLYSGDRFIELARNKQEWRTNEKMPMVSIAQDTFYSNIYDTTLAVKATPRNKEDVGKAKAYKSYVERGFSVSESKQTFDQCTYETILMGNSFARVGFEDSESQVEYLKGGEVKTLDRKMCNPALYYVSPFQVLFDLGVKNFYKKRWFGWRNIMTYQSAIERYENALGIKITEDEKKVILKSPAPFSTMDYDRVKQIKSYETWIRRDCISHFINGGGSLDQYEKAMNVFTEQNVYQIASGEDDYIEVLEYRENKKLVLAFNGYIVYDGINPYPFEEIPFVQFTYEKTPGFVLAKGIGQKLASLQKILDLTHNCYNDALKMHVAPMFKVIGKGPYKEEVLTYTPYGIKEAVSDKDFEIIKLVDVNALSSAIANIDLYTAMADKVVGLNSYTTGGQGKVERSAGAAASRTQVTKSRLLPLVDGMNSALSKIGEMWAQMALAYMPEEFTVKILSPEEQAEFVKVTASDLAGQFDIEFDSQSLRNLSREVKRAQTLELMQSISHFNIDPMRGNRPIVDIVSPMRELLDSYEIGQDAIPTDEQYVAIVNKAKELLSQVQAGNAAMPADIANAPIPEPVNAAGGPVDTSSLPLSSPTSRPSPTVDTSNIMRQNAQI